VVLVVATRQLAFTELHRLFRHVARLSYKEVDSSPRSCVLIYSF